MNHHLKLEEIKEIMVSAHFDKMQALKSHKKLLVLKRDRLNGLIELVNKTLKGETTMSFEEFDMSEYYNALEDYKKEHEDNIIKSLGSIDKYNEKGFMIESYLVEGKQNVGCGTYGKSITDACLGWKSTERLIYNIAENL